MLSTRMFRPASSVARQSVASQRLFHASRAALAVHHVKTKSRAEEFKQVVKEQEKVLVDCFATWCGPCKAIAPILEKASDEAEFKDRVHFVKFDVDELPELSQQLGIRAMPTFLFFKNGEKVDEMIGANPPLLLQTLRKHNA
ncbi:thioredoxin domain-containing [Trichoderma cornu-damae]|uniref:Thioredoxin domain-containing n=1 Tax=Trichoderma cornu-damae TaxID=654480 RepID=A0A9P8QRI0_9HYPO|nr:thioredoxin domain-containing [Trichoderma cornu-damae]